MQIPDWYKALEPVSNTGIPCKGGQYIKKDTGVGFLLLVCFVLFAFCLSVYIWVRKMGAHMTIHRHKYECAHMGRSTFVSPCLLEIDIVWDRVSGCLQHSLGSLTCEPSGLPKENWDNGDVLLCPSLHGHGNPTSVSLHACTENTLATMLSPQTPDI